MKLNFMLRKFVQFIVSFFSKLNLLCKQYEYLLQTIGIAVGLYLIYLTYISVKISSEQLRITQNQEYQKQLPIWKFEINDEKEIAQLFPFSSDVKLEQATAYFSKGLFYKNCSRWEIDQPDFFFHLTMFKSYMEDLVEANTRYDTIMYSVASRNEFPVGIELDYIQFGELRTVSAIFSIQYFWVRGKNVTITIKGIKFKRYIMSNENLLNELDEIVKKEFTGFKKPEFD